MKTHYENWNDKAIRAAFPATKTHFDKNDNETDAQVLLEVTDACGEIVEIKVGPQDYIRFSIQRLNQCAAAFRQDYAKEADHADHA